MTIHKEEFRCSEATAMKIKEDDRVTYAWAPFMLPDALGIPLIVNDDIAEGRLEFWRDDSLIKVSEV